jgi:hypothetical protein
MIILRGTPEMPESAETVGFGRLVREIWRTVHHWHALSRFAQKLLLATFLNRTLQSQPTDAICYADDHYLA